MKFKATVIGFLIAILSVNIFMAYTVIQEEKKQTDNINALINAKIQEYGQTGQRGLYDLLRETAKDIEEKMP